MTTRDEVLAMAEQAGDVETDARGRITITFDDHGLERFHALAVAPYKEDAERYRWHVSMAWGKPLDVDASVHELTFRTFSVSGKWESTKAVADEAIDRARSAK